VRSVKIAYLALLLALLAPATASAQTPPPDERAAAQALADAAKRLIADADTIDGDPRWIEDCRALRREPPERRKDAATDYLDGLVIRGLLDDLEPAVNRARGEIADVRTADPVLISGRASVRRILRRIAAFPAGEPDPCAAYAAYARAGYPRKPAREARALQRSLDSLATRGMERKIGAAADRMVELGVAREDAQAFRDLAS
jgi:hypothetical protein